MQEGHSVIATSSHSVNQPKQGIAARVETTKANSFGYRREDLKQKDLTMGQLILFRIIFSLQKHTGLFGNFSVIIV